MKRVSIIIVLFCFCISLTSCNFFDDREDEYNQGIEYYLENWNKFSTPLTRYLVYSVDFVEKYDYIDGDYHCYIENPFKLSYVGKGDRSILYLTYDEGIYQLARNDIFDNTVFTSETPIITYNGYVFFQRCYSGEDVNLLILTAFNDEINTIVFLDFEIMDSSLLENQDPAKFGEFLEKYYGEFYDFSTKAIDDVTQ